MNADGRGDLERLYKVMLNDKGENNNAMGNVSQVKRPEN